MASGIWDSWLSLVHARVTLGLLLAAVRILVLASLAGGSSTSPEPSSTLAPLLQGSVRLLVLASLAGGSSASPA